MGQPNTSLRFDESDWSEEDVPSTSVPLPPPSSLDVYLHEIALIPRLTKDEERELSLQIQRDQKALLVALCDLPLALDVIQGWYRSVADGSLKFQEFLQNSNIEDDSRQEKDEQENTPEERKDKCYSIAVACARFSHEQMDYYTLRQRWNGSTRSIYERARNQLVQTLQQYPPAPRLLHKLARDYPALGRSKTGLPPTIEKPLVTNLSQINHRLIAAKKRFAEANLRLVVFIAKRYQNRGLGMQDLVQEGSLGLMRGVERYDAARGYNFSTYAVRCVQNAITRGIENQARTIRVSSSALEAHAKVIRIGNRLRSQMGRDATPEDIAVASRMPLEDVKKALDIPPDAIKISFRDEDSEDGALAQYIPDKHSDAFEYVAEQMLERQVGPVLRALPTREREILSLSFGLGGADAHNHGYLANKYSVTRQCIDQIHTRALRRLRNQACPKPLADYPFLTQQTPELYTAFTQHNILTVQDLADALCKDGKRFQRLGYYIDRFLSGAVITQASQGMPYVRVFAIRIANAVHMDPEQAYARQIAAANEEWEHKKLARRRGLKASTPAL